jgi:hypothetical protein
VEVSVGVADVWLGVVVTVGEGLSTKVLAGSLVVVGVGRAIVAVGGGDWLGVGLSSAALVGGGCVVTVGAISDAVGMVSTEAVAVSGEAVVGPATTSVASTAGPAHQSEFRPIRRAALAISRTRIRAVTK